MRLAGFLTFFKPKFIQIPISEDMTETLDTFYQEFADKIQDHQLEAWEMLERQKEELKAFAVREKTIWREIENQYILPKKALALSFDRETKRLGYYK